MQDLKYGVLKFETNIPTYRGGLMDGIWKISQ